MRQSVCDTWTEERDGFLFRIDIECDDDGDPPWERSDCHGPVSDWQHTKMTKKPGEIVLHRDCGRYRFYDFAEATRIAKRDGWGLSDMGIERLHNRLGHAPSRKEIVRKAVQKDFNYLRSWCNDEWHYVGVVVTLVPEGTDTDDVDIDYFHALWGIESNDIEGIKDVAEELMDQILAERRNLEAEAANRATAEAKEAAYWANMDIATVEG